METSTWIAMLGLGAAHGINPAMGWLFAVALGLQEGRARAVWRSLPPLALGHATAIAAAVGAAAALGRVVPLDGLKWGVAAVLLAFAVYRLVRSHRPVGGGMRVGPRDLAVWSFLMASAHGAGLMVLPFVLGDAGVAGHGAHAGHGAALASAGGGAVLASLVHAGGYLLVTAAVALLVFHRLGLRRLRSAWVNLDLLWAGALILTALATPWL